VISDRETSSGIDLGFVFVVSLLTLSIATINSISLAIRFIQQWTLIGNQMAYSTWLVAARDFPKLFGKCLSLNAEFLFPALTPVCSPSFSRLEQITANGSGKVVAKSEQPRLVGSCD